MRFQPLALAALLFACTDPESDMANEADNALAADESGSSGMPTEDGDGGGGGGNGGGDNGDGDGGGTPLPPGTPGTPPPEPPAPEPEPAGSVTLSAGPARVAPGATVRLRLENGLRQPIGYNLCTSSLIRNGAPVQTDRVCTLELRTLQPGASTTYGWELPDDLAAGNYRFSTGVERMRSGNRIVVRSNGFRVTR